LSGRARIAELKGEWELALEQNRAYLLANPADPVIHTAIAGNLRELGDYEEAEHSVRETLRLIPAGANALVELSRIYAAQGDVAEAEAALQQALTIWAAADPEYKPAAEARVLLETLLQPTGDTGV
jgi:tetratricopeptide (TPR) repeat protein